MIPWKVTEAKTLTNVGGIKVAHVISFIVLAVSAIILLGWFLDNEVLVSLAPGWPVFRPWSAIALIFLSLAVIGQTSRSLILVNLGRLGAFIGTCIGLYGLAEHLFNFTTSAGIYLWQDTHLALTTIEPGRIPTPAAVTIVLLGVAILFMRAEQKKYHTVFVIATVLSFVLPSLALIGYLYDALPFLVLWGTTGMASSAAVCFILMGVAISASRSDAPPASWLLNSDDKITVVRLLMMAFMLPAVYRIVNAACVKLELDTATSTAVALLFTAIIMAIGVLVVGVGERRNARIIREERERFSVAFSDAPVGMGVLDLQGHLTEVNEALCWITGENPANLFGRNIVEFIWERDAENLREDLYNIANGLQRHIRSDVRFVRANGDPIWVDLHITAVLSGDGSGTKYFLLQVLDLSDRKRAERILRHQAHHDPLTGLANRAGLDAYLETLLNDEQEPESSISLVFFDLDGFKAVNDNNGHDVGDRMLEEVAARLLKVVRADDFVARIGGDEFVMVIHASPDHKMLQTRLRTAIEGPVTIKEKDLIIKISVGVSDLTGTDYREAIILADKAMYEDKVERYPGHHAGTSEIGVII